MAGNHRKMLFKFQFFRKQTLFFLEIFLSALTPLCILSFFFSPCFSKILFQVLQSYFVRLVSGLICIKSFFSSTSQLRDRPGSVGITVENNNNKALFLKKYLHKYYRHTTEYNTHCINNHKKFHYQEDSFIVLRPKAAIRLPGLIYIV